MVQAYAGDNTAWSYLTALPPDLLAGLPLLPQNPTSASAIVGVSHIVFYVSRSP